MAEGTQYFQCPKCKKRYKTLRGLESHASSHALKEEQGTPAAESFDFQCPLCPKSFKTKRGLDSHQRNCAVKGRPNVNASAPDQTASVGSSSSSSTVPTGLTDQPTQDFTAEAEVEEETMFPDEPFLHDVPLSEEKHLSYFEAEEEMEEARRSGSTSDDQPKKVNEKNKQAKKAIVYCRPCKKSYFFVDGYANHMVSHAFLDLLTLKGPPLSTVLEGSQEMLKQSITKVISCQTKAGKGPLIVEAAEELLKLIECEEMITFSTLVFTGLYNSGMCSGKGNLHLPSDLRTSFVKATAGFMGNLTERKTLSDLLCKLLPEKESLLPLLIPCIIRQMQMSQVLVVFIVGRLIGEVENLDSIRVNTDENTSSVDFIQNMHYVGGSNVCSVLRTARRYANGSEEWASVIRVLKDNFIASDLTEPPPPEFSEWTDLQSNGGLIKVTRSAGEFFVALGQLVKPLERIDGSLINEDVIEKVCSAPKMLVLWDALVKDCLPKTQSFKLLYAICNHFCVTWRSGIISRRMDAIQKKKKSSQQGKGGINFRATL